MKDPWYKTSFQWKDAIGSVLSIQVPHDVFSTQRLDEGTLLFLGHLPKSEPKFILDMGCGYGALGLPVAARFPEAQVEMVDRDLLAVKWSALNAAANNLKNVTTFGSLGFRDLPKNHPAYDWILCNMPARIGRPFIKNFIDSGREKLSTEGTLSIVVINDLATSLVEMAQEYQWPLLEVVRGPRHTVFSISSMKIKNAISDPVDLYLRDQVDIQGMKFDRPFDLGGDDPKRLTMGLPVLLDALPRQVPEGGFKKTLCFRCGYGQLPLMSRKRWPDSTVIAVDRDLLATSFTRSNADKLKLNGERLVVRESAHFPDAILPDESYDLILGELSPSVGEAVTIAELKAIARALSPGGQALLLCLDKLEKDWIRPFSKSSGIPIQIVIKRDGYTVLRLEI